MSQLRSNPVREVPKRVLLIALVITVLITGVTLLFDWPTILVIAGFWMGVVINLINFRIIVIGSKNFLEKVEAGKKASMTPNILLRFLLYGAVFVIAWRVIGVPALLGSFLGACMVNFALKSDGFFTMGLDKKEPSDLTRRASIESLSETESGHHPEEKSDGPNEEPENKVKISEIEKVDNLEETGRHQEELEEEEIEVYL